MHPQGYGRDFGDHHDFGGATFGGGHSVHKPLLRGPVHVVGTADFWQDSFLLLRWSCAQQLPPPGGKRAACCKHESKRKRSSRWSQIKQLFSESSYVTEEQGKCRALDQAFWQKASQSIAACLCLRAANI